MSMRGVATGWAGSAAVLLVAATSLGAVRAQADATPDHKAVQVVVAAEKPPVKAKVEGVSNSSAKPPALRPAWLRRLLSPSDLEPVRKPG